MREERCRRWGEEGRVRKQKEQKISKQKVKVLSFFVLSYILDLTFHI